VDSLPSDWIGSRRGIWGAAGGDGNGDAEGERDVGHRAVDSDAGFRLPEIDVDGAEDEEGDVPVEAELVDCGAMAPCPWTRRMKATTTLRCGAWRVIGILPVDRSW
jgi:hypothetical protein